MLAQEESIGVAGATPLQPGVREELILRHLPQVRLIARRVSERLPGWVNLEDLISAGTVGLIAAIDRFNPQQHVKLRTYAEYKIRGAILDSLRKDDWAPRQQRRRERMIRTAIREMGQRLDRMPTEEEIAQQLQVPVEQYRVWLKDERDLKVSSLEQAGEEEGRRVLRHLVNMGEKSPSQILEQAEMESRVKDVIRNLPSLEGTILSLYFYEEMTLRKIARVLSLHESRISQIKAQALSRIRTKLQSSSGSR